MSHSSTTSLLHQHRPSDLLPQAPAGLSISQQQLCLEQHEAQRLAERAGTRSNPVECSPSSTACSSQITLVSDCSCSKQQPVASASSGMAYLNVDPTGPMTSDTAVPESTPPIKQCRSQLKAAAFGVLGEVQPREQWQPDEDSSLCTYPLCSTIFGPPSYFSFGPRRHHCRLCGQIFCGTHSSQRAHLIARDVQGQPRLSKQRVCDLCIGKTEEDNALVRRISNDSSSSAPSDDIVTPLSEHPLSRTTSLHLSRSHEIIDECAERGLAPVQGWMDRDGVLSLYPLAVHPSHSNAVIPPSAGPLFQPSLSARRTARVKEYERLSLRQRRLGHDNAVWLPAKWGYRREDFDPELDSDDESMTPGGLVVDGPIRYRAPGVKRVASVRTPSEERPMSTF